MEEGERGMRGGEVTCEGKAMLLPIVVIVDFGAEDLLHEVLRIGAVHLGEGAAARRLDVRLETRAHPAPPSSRSIQTLPPINDATGRAVTLGESASGRGRNRTIPIWHPQQWRWPSLAALHCPPQRGFGIRLKTAVWFPVASEKLERNRV